MKTHSTRAHFAVKESETGAPFWIMMDDAQVDGLPRNSYIGFELRDDTDFEQAKAVAAFLNKHIKNMTFTA